MRGRNLFWFLSLYAWHTGETSWRYCFNCLWPSGKYMYRVSYDSRNRTFFIVRQPPKWARPRRCRGFTITPRHTHTHTHTHTNSVGLLWTSDQPVAETSITPNTTSMPLAGFEPAIPASDACRTLLISLTQQWRQRTLCGRNWHITYKLENCTELK